MISKSIADRMVSATDIYEGRFANQENFYKETILPKVLASNAWWRPGFLEERSCNREINFRIQVIVKEVFSPSTDKILEVGCGELETLEHLPDYKFSYLSRIFYGVEWVFSDHPEAKTHDLVVAYDLTKKPPFSEKFESVIGCNVLDTIPYADLTAALGSIRDVLKPKGVFLHLATSNFYTTAFVEACSKLSDVLLPGPDQEIYQLSLQEVQAVINGPDATEIEKEMLAKWINKATHIQACVINDRFMGVAVGPEQVHLQNRMKVLFPAAETSTLDRSFVENIQRAAEKNDLEVTRCEFDSINEKKKIHVIALRLNSSFEASRGLFSPASIGSFKERLQAINNWAWESLNFYQG